MLWLLFSWLCVQSSRSWSQETLVSTHVIVRHGSRVPNFDFWNLCPNQNFANDFKYPPAYLSGLGRNQLIQLGKVLRARYTLEKQFLNIDGMKRDNLGRFAKQIELFAEKSPRTVDTAGIIGRQIFDNLDSLVNVEHTTMDLQDIMKAVSTICKEAKVTDTKSWDNEYLELWKNKDPAVRILSQKCNSDPANWTFGNLKDLSDGFLFSYSENFKPNITFYEASILQNSEHDLFMERYYKTRRKVLYWIGGLFDEIFY
eukprot:UN24892